MMTMTMMMTNMGGTGSFHTSGERMNYVTIGLDELFCIYEASLIFLLRVIPVDDFSKWQRRSSHQQNSATSSSVSTGIGDHLWRVYRSGIYPGHSVSLSLAIPSGYVQ